MKAIVAAPFVRQIFILGSLLSVPVLAPATPLEITFAGQWRDHTGPNSVGRTFGDRHVLDAFVKELSGAPAPDDTRVSASNGAFEIELTRASDISQEFNSGRAFGTIPTTPWTITAESGGDQPAIRLTHDITDAQLLPFVRNVRIEPEGLTPTLLWDAPSGGLPASVDRIRVGLFDDDSNDRLPFFDGSVFKNLEATATSFKFEPGDLVEDTNYVFRVMLEDRDPSPGGGPFSRSRTFINFTTDIVGGDDAVFLPTVDEDGIFHFDFDVATERRFLIDPFVAIGYEYATGSSDDPNFASVELPFIGDGEFLLSYLDGGNLVEEILAAGVEYIFPDDGVDAFTVMGIEASAMLDPDAVTAFATTLSFVEDGAFTGTMTPITEFVPDSVPEPTTLVLIGLGLAGIGYQRNKQDKAA